MQRMAILSLTLLALAGLPGCGGGSNETDRGNGTFEENPTRSDTPTPDLSEEAGGTDQEGVKTSEETLQATPRDDSGHATAEGSRDDTGGGSDATSETSEGSGAAGSTASAESTEGAVGTYGDNFRFISRYDGPSFVEITDVNVVEETAFICTGTQGLLLYDVADPAHMTMISQVFFSQGDPMFPRCQHVVIDRENGRAFVANHGDEIQPTPWITVLDIRLPRSVRELAFHIEEGFSYEGLAWHDGFLYAAAHDAGIEIFRVESSGALTPLARFREGLENAWQVEVSGRYAFVADGTGGLKVLDVADPAAPTLVAQGETSGVANDIVLGGDFAFLAVGGAGIDLFDVSDPRSPRLVANIDTPGSALRLSLSNDRLYLANWNDIRVFDVSNPYRPFLAAVEVAAADNGQPFTRVLGIGSEGDLAFGGEWTGLQSFAFLPGFDAPDIFTTETSIELGRVAPGESYTFPLQIVNEGRLPLSIDRIYVSDEVFAVSETSLSIPPGQGAIVEVRFTPRNSDPIVGMLQIVSDDPDEPLYEVELRANEPTLQPGDPAPDWLLSDIYGNPYQLSDYRGNVVVLAYFATF